MITIISSTTMICVLIVSCVGSIMADNGTVSDGKGIRVVDWKFDHLESYFLVTLYLLIIGMVRMWYHNTSCVSTYIPESCILIFLGTAIGGLLYLTNDETPIVLSPDLFFLLLLPPIILEASFDVATRSFFDNMGTILLFAVVGTFLNFLVIGFVLYGMCEIGAMATTEFRFSLTHSLLFSSVLVAVDPVAVLAIFQTIGVDRTLHTLVFGESLFNDAVTVVLYNMMKAFAVSRDTSSVQIVLGVVSFFTISLGGLLVGLVIGALCCILSRFTRQARILEPVLLISAAYLAYIVADMLGWSGIISMIGCGCLEAIFAFRNIHKKSVVSVKGIVKILSSTSEATIFLFLGVEVVSTRYANINFTLNTITIWIPVLVRTLVVYGLCFGLNKFGREHPISLTEQFVMSYGGLRGAVSFALAVLIPANSLIGSGLTPALLINGALSLIFFTVVIMGTTVRPIVRCLRIRLEKVKEVSLSVEIVEQSMDICCHGIEDIIGSAHFGRWRQAIGDRVYTILAKFLLIGGVNNDSLLATLKKSNQLLFSAAQIRDDAKHDKLPQLLRRDRDQPADSYRMYGVSTCAADDETYDCNNLAKNRKTSRSVALLALNKVSPSKSIEKISENTELTPVNSV